MNEKLMASADRIADLQAENKLLKSDKRELVEALEKMNKAYVSLLETGRDRIVDCGGDCDTVERMEASSPYLRASKAAISKHKDK